MAAADVYTNISVTLPPAREVPSSFISSVRSWWSAGDKDSAISEERILRALPFFESSNWSRRSTSQPIIGSSSQLKLSSKKHYLNTFSITHTSPSPSAPPPAVLLHGYGAGLAFFFRNFPALGRWVAQSGSALHAVDWLGMGRSARVPFRVTAKKDDIPGRVREAEDFFVDSLEDWRQRMGLEKMTLIGHSLGGYLSVAYALKYPTRVHKLVLLSPAGVPRGENSSTDPSREITDDQQQQMHASPNGNEASVQLASKQRVEKVHEEQEQQREPESRRRRLFTYLWEEGWSPFQVVRNMTVFGPMLIGKYSTRRFSGLTEEETRNMHDYILNITLAKGSGEYCISHILAPFAQARLPLVDRVSAIKVPITFVYGDHDWMDPEGGSVSVDRLKKAGNTKARMYIIKNAGHHVYLDNPDAINELLLKELNRS